MLVHPDLGVVRGRVCDTLLFQLTNNHGKGRVVASLSVIISLVGLIAAGVASAAPPQTATLAVENMTCGTCPIVVKKALEHVPGVTSTSVDFDKKTATVTFDPDKATSAKLTQATTEAGFPSKVVSQP